jgi:type 1 glutamine amidotransferase
VTAALAFLLFIPMADPKPHVVIVSAEDEYQTETTLPAFAARHLADCRVSLVTADPKNKHHLLEIGKLNDADLMILSVRRRPLVTADLDAIKAYVKSKKPIVAIRTSSHAFAPKKGEKPPPGTTAWESFDEEVLGCKYTGHFPNTVKTVVSRPAAAKDYPVLKGISADPFVSPSWLYKSNPLAKDCTVLLIGTAGENAPEPAAWVREKSAERGRLFYTCLGHPGDFELPEFVTLLKNGISWAKE